MIGSIVASAQNLDGFEKMCNQYVSGTIPLASPSQLRFEMSRDSNLVILDARAIKEFKVSHIPNAQYVGADQFKRSSVASIPKDAKIYIYCSIGYRSEKIGEKLKKAGYQHVYNLKGGLFSWANHGFSLEDSSGNPTRLVHGYDKKWGAWLNSDQCEKVLN